MTNETASHSAKSLFAGKARTVAAVAAFSGLALATTVSVQATQNADEQAPAAAVSEAPASENTVSAQPAAKADKAEKAKEKKTEKAKAPAQPAAIQAAPVADVTPVAPQVAPAAETVTPVAETVTPAAETVTPVAETAAPAAPVAQQGRHAAEPTAQTLQAETAAQQHSQVADHNVQGYGDTQAKASNTGGTVTPQSTQQTKPASGSVSGQGILGAAEGQIGVNQDCTALVSNALRAVGINHHGWPASYKSLGRSVSAAEAQAGDIAYYADGGAGVAHVAIYAGNGQAIHGGWNGNQTVKTTAYVGSGPEFIRVG
ncbi:C40 family peptidase [Kocuria rhizophila]|uniref:C40 family peptidase n=1 Tax=Kocuria rhizophila TaxID=72000 RepID=UPI00190AF1AF|nr:NlpC/P60 family protein [Kocuria rhizophila]MBK4121248.1 C40 family peptidase [Kocuria rhizophila]